MIPQANATLTQVAEAPRTDTFRDSEVLAAVSLWQGAAGCYYQEKRERTPGAAEDLLVRRSLLVEEGNPVVPPPSGQTAGGFQSEQVVTFTFGGVAQTGTIQHVERRVFPIAGSVQSTRLTLSDT